jgi:hypothetical protein
LSEIQTDPLTPAEPSSARRPPFLAIILLVPVVALAFYIGTNVLSVLYGVVAPPLPPLPPYMDQISHDSPAYGVDNWKYTSTEGACQLVKYVIDNGGTCQIAPMQCGDYRELHTEFSIATSVVARCSGKMNFSIFNEQWWSLVTRTIDDKAKFELNREVYWLGTGPQ